MLDYAHEFIVEFRLLVRDQAIELFILGVQETDAVLLAGEAVRKCVEIIAREGLDVSCAF